MWAIYSSFAELNRKIMPSSVIVVLINAMAEEGVFVDELREKYNLTDERLFDVNEMVSPIEAQLFVLEALSLHEDKPISFQYGKQLGVNLLGDLGLVMMAAGTLKEAIYDLRQYVKTFNYLLNYEIKEVEDELFLIPDLGVYSHGPEYNLRFSIEAVLSSCLAIFKFLVGEAIHPQAVYFSFDKPRYIERYKELFGDNIIFGAEKNMLVYNQKDITKAVLTGNQYVHEMYKKRCDEKLKKLDDSQAIELLTMGYLRDAREVPSFEQLAFGLGFTPNALRRRLALAGTTYQECVDKVRLERAEELLKYRNESVESIALQLGFTDASNFRRAFKRWTGETPSDFRRQFA